MLAYHNPKARCWPIIILATGGNFKYSTAGTTAPRASPFAVNHRMETLKGCILVGASYKNTHKITPDEAHPSGDVQKGSQHQGKTGAR